MSNLENLVIKRVKILSEINKLKADSSIGHCQKQYKEVNHQCGILLEMVRKESCIELIYKECKELNHNAYEEFYSYDEVFYNSDDDPCEHCKKLRANKKERMKLRRHFGQVNAAITRIGKKLLLENQ